MDKQRLLNALERAVRTFIQAAAGMMLGLLTVQGAGWDDLPDALLAGAFAGLLAVLALYAVPPRQG
jgi:hypothetical protein